MKKILFSFALLTGLNAAAQLPNGSIAPDFTLTDIDGNTHNLYTYLDQGKTVFIDISATWCGPCWNFHNTHALDNLWAAHGPAGGNGVNAGTTDDVMVIYIEGDGTTNSADLHGTGSDTQGDWVTGVEHPIIDPAASVINAFNDDYAIGYFPTIYKICPNRIISEIGQATATQLYASVASCPPPASQTTDVSALSYLAATSVCGPADYSPIVQIQNYGTTNLTAATIEVTMGGNVVSTGVFAGDLATYGVASVTCTPIAGFTGGNLSFVITTTGDGDAANGTMTKNIASASEANGLGVIVQITTDAYGSETTWNIKNSSNVTVASGGPYNDIASGNGTTVQAAVNVTLDPTECYKFNIMDEYGDGISGSYGNGSYKVKDASNNAILVQGGAFAESDSKGFKSGSAPLAVNKLDANTISIYPNPVADVVRVSAENLKQIDVIQLVDQAGRVLTSWNVNASAMDLNVAAFANGNYLLVFKGENTQITQKMQINK